jgi:hypothetical protein
MFYINKNNKPVKAGLTTQKNDGDFCEAIRNKRAGFHASVKPTKTQGSKNKMSA